MTSPFLQRRVLRKWSKPVFGSAFIAALFLLALNRRPTPATQPSIRDDSPPRVLRVPPKPANPVPLVYAALGTACVGAEAVQQAALVAKKVIVIVENVGACMQLYSSLQNYDRIEIRTTEELAHKDLAAIDQSYGEGSNRQFEIFCLQRYVYLRELAKEMKLEVSLYLDGDVMLYEDPTDLWISTATLAPPEVNLRSSIFLTHGCSLTSFWNAATLSDMVRFIIYVLQNHPEPGYNDMRITKYYSAIVTQDGTFPNPNAPGVQTIEVPSGVTYRPNHLVQAIPVEPDHGMPEETIFVDRKFRALNIWRAADESVNFGDGTIQVKMVFFCNNRIYFHHLPTGKLIRSATLHFQGPSKNALPAYSLRKRKQCVCTTPSCDPCLDIATYATRIAGSDREFADRLRKVCL